MKNLGANWPLKKKFHVEPCVAAAAEAAYAWNQSISLTSCRGDTIRWEKKDLEEYLIPITVERPG